LHHKSKKLSISSSPNKGREIILIWEFSSRSGAPWLRKKKKKQSGEGKVCGGLRRERRSETADPKGLLPG